MADRRDFHRSPSATGPPSLGSSCSAPSRPGSLEGPASPPLGTGWRPLNTAVGGHHARTMIRVLAVTGLCVLWQPSVAASFPPTVSARVFPGAMIATPDLFG